MNEKEAREIIASTEYPEKLLNTDQRRQIGLKPYAMWEKDRAIGYLEAIEKVEPLVEAVKGLSLGEDWNNGTHAKIYRPKLLNALAKWEEIR